MAKMAISQDPDDDQAEDGGLVAQEATPGVLPEVGWFAAQSEAGGAQFRLFRGHSSLLLTHTNAWVDRTIDDIDREVGQRDEKGVEEGGAHDHGIVAARDGFDVEAYVDAKVSMIKDGLGWPGMGPGR